MKNEKFLKAKTKSMGSSHFSFFIFHFSFIKAVFL